MFGRSIFKIVFHGRNTAGGSRSYLGVTMLLILTKTSPGTPDFGHSPN